MNLPVKRTVRSWWEDSVLPWSLPIPTHDLWNSKFWMPKVCKRGRTLPMLVRSSPNACCCQWIAAMAHTALPTERCASVWKCFKLPKAPHENVAVIICETGRKNLTLSVFPCVLIAIFFSFFKENSNNMSNKISGPTVRFTFSLCFFCGKLPTTRHWLWRHFLRSPQWSVWKWTSEFWRLWISGTLYFFTSSLEVMTSWNIMKCTVVNEIWWRISWRYVSTAVGSEQPPNICNYQRSESFKSFW